MNPKNLLATIKDGNAFMQLFKTPLFFLILLLFIFNSCTKDNLTPKRYRLSNYTLNYSSSYFPTDADFNYSKKYTLAYDNSGRISEKYSYVNNSTSVVEDYNLYAYSVNSSNKLTSIVVTDAENDIWNYTIGDNGFASKLSVVYSDNSTASENLTYDSNGYLLKEIYSSSSASYTYSKGNCTSILNTDNTVTTITYDNNDYGAFNQPIIFDVSHQSINLIPISFKGRIYKNYPTKMVYPYNGTDYTYDFKYGLDSNHNITKILVNISTKAYSDLLTINFTLNYEQY